MKHNWQKLASPENLTLYLLSFLFVCVRWSQVSFLLKPISNRFHYWLLAHSMLGKKFSRRYFKLCFSYIFPENRFWNIMQIVSIGNFKACYLGKKENIINLSSTESVQRVEKANFGQIKFTRLCRCLLDRKRQYTFYYFMITEAKIDHWVSFYLPYTIFLFEVDFYDTVNTSQCLRCSPLI